jgi:hypothetical protein
MFTLRVNPASRSRISKQSSSFPVRSLKNNGPVRQSSTEKSYPADWAKLAQKELKGKAIDDLVWKTAEVNP